MAKKKANREDVDMDFDDLGDLSDLDEGLDLGSEMDGIDDDNREPSRSKIIGELAKEAGQGAFDEAIRTTAKKTLPDEYSAHYYDAMDLASFTKEVVEKNKQQLNKSTYRLGKEISKILPFKLSMLDKYLEDQQSDFETQRQASEDEMRDTAVKSELTGIFDKQLEVQKAIEAKHSAEDEVDKRQRLIQHQMSQDVLTSIDANVAQQTAFTIQISKEYYRRSLELQFKSYYVQADMLRVMRDHYKAFAVQFTNIEKNTSLPDFVKLRSTEKFKDVMREQAVQSVYRTVFSNNKYVETVKKRLGGLVDEKVSEITNSMDTATEMLSNLSLAAEGSGMSGAQLAGGVAAGMGGGILGESLANKIPERWANKIKNNKYIQTGANMLGTYGTSASAAMESMKDRLGKLKEDNDDAATPTRWLKNKVGGIFGTALDIATPGGEKFEVKNQGYLGHKSAAIFDNRAHRSITEAIPMFLSAILKQTTDLRQMYGVVNAEVDGVASVNSPLYIYDYKNRSLDTKANVSSNMAVDLFKTKNTAAKTRGIAQTMLNETSKSVKTTEGLTDKEKKKSQETFASKESDKLLQKYIEKAAGIEGQSLTYDDLITNYKNNEELMKIVESSGKLKDLLEDMAKVRVTNKQIVDSRLSDAKRQYPIEPIKLLFSKLSQLSASGTTHNLDDATAEVFAKAFTTYTIRSGGTAVVSSTVINGKVFTIGLTKADYDSNPKVQVSTSIIIADCIRIENTSDILTITAMESLFAMVHASLSSNVTISPEVFQEMEDLSPGVVGEGGLGADQLVSGKLGVMDKETQYLDMKTIKELKRTSGAELKNRRQDQAAENTIDKLIRGGMENSARVAKSILANKNNPSAILDILKEELNNAKTSVSDRLDKNVNALKVKLEEQFGDLSNLENKAIGVVIAKMIDGTDSTMKLLDENILLLEQDINERIAAASNATNVIDDITDRDAVRGKVGKLTEAMFVKKQEIHKLLKSIRQTLETQKYTLQANLDIVNQPGGQTSAQVSMTQMVTKLRDLFTGNLTKVKNALAEYEAAAGSTAPQA